MATIKDVAKEAGVSLGTVSNVLNNLPSVSPANRDAVHQAIQKLGYQKNEIASWMRSNVSKTLGLIVPNIANPFYSEIARGIDDTARRYEYTVFLCNTDRDRLTERELIQTLCAKSVDGLIILKPMNDHAFIEKIAEERCVLLFDADPDKYQKQTIVNVDDDLGVRIAMNKIVEKNHKKIAIVYAEDGSYSVGRRFHAFLKSLEANQISLPDAYIIKGDFSIESGMCALDKLMSLKEPPTAIFAMNDMMAEGVLFRAKQLNICVPETISVIGYDDIEDAKWMNPPLTTVWHPKYEVGSICADLLLKQIQEKRKKHQIKNAGIKILEPHLVERASLMFP